jgi:hypothetical protein
MNKRKFVFDIGPPLLASDLNVLIGLKKKKIIESIPEPKFDVSDVELIKQAVFENEGIRLPPASNLNQHPDLVFGREPIKAEIEDIQLYAEDRNVKKVTEKVLSLVRGAPLIKPKLPTEQELATLKRRADRVQAAKDKVISRNVGPQPKSIFDELKELDEI